MLFWGRYQYEFENSLWVRGRETAVGSGVRFLCGTAESLVRFPRPAHLLFSRSHPAHRPLGLWSPGEAAAAPERPLVRLPVGALSTSLACVAYSL